MKAGSHTFMGKIKLDKERELKFNLNALNKIKEKFGSLDGMEQALSKGADPLDAVPDLIWLLTLLANQSIIERNMDIEYGIESGEKEKLLTEEYVSIKMNPADIIGKKNSIFDALTDGMSFTAISEEEESDEVLAEIDSQKNV